MLRSSPNFRKFAKIRFLQIFFENEKPIIDQAQSQPNLFMYNWSFARVPSLTKQKLFSYYGNNTSVLRSIHSLILVANSSCYRTKWSPSLFRKTYNMYVDLHFNGCYLSFREITLEVLSQEPEGAFMVRESTSKPGCYALSLRVPREFQPSGIAHYLIMRTNKGYKIKVKFV